MFSPKLIASPDTLSNLAAVYGTPLYVYDSSMIRQRCQTLAAAFKGLPVKWLYAIKANDNPHVLKVIKDEGFGFDTVSFEEALLSLKIGQRPEKIFYTENNMTDEEMFAAVEAGVILNIGSYSRLEQFARLKNTRECSIRVNPQIGDGHHAKVDTGNRDSKFGIRLDLIPAAVEMAGEHGVKITGIHIHIGSGIQKPENLTQAMKVLLDIGRVLPDLKRINFGGGFPIPYKEGDAPFSITRFAEAASPLLKEELDRRGGDLVFHFEPGRWIVAPAGLLLTRVNTVKDQGRITFLGTDTGFNHLLRPAMYESYHAVVNVTRAGEEADKTYTIAGNICETGDILAEDRKLPETSNGELLALCDAGAYGMTMASNYNRRSVPSEVLIADDGTPKLIRERETAEAIVDRFLKESFFVK
ncbi:MAG: diaminopimelate decarboxylase [Bacteroidetes bacterium]|nr:diaminopimelate decarboxylase [Bacteroidota bacterium]